MSRKSPSGAVEFDMPELKLLAKDPVRKARLITIRAAIEHLLAKNYLSHFTDHSAAHSDRLCELVDQLTFSIDRKTSLSSQEAAILYAACYFHDAGMQHERAGDTQVVRSLLQADPFRGQRWSDLSQATKKDLVRRYHHRISNELVRSAVNSGKPALGITLKDEDKPGITASLCLAHCLYLPKEAQEYSDNTADQSGIRVGLLSALLRLADILDESQQRSHLFLEHTTELPLDSRLHWWRHYYVSQIIVAPRSVTVWFDFPPHRRAQYREIFEPLQMPWIEAEFRRHASVLSANGLAWNLEARDTPEAQCTTQVMDEELERYAVEQAVKRQAEKLQVERGAVVRQLKIARPTIERQLQALRDSTDSPDTQLDQALKLSEYLWAIGGHRDAWVQLSSHYYRLNARVEENRRVRTVLRLAEFMIEDGASAQALHQLQDIEAQCMALPDDHENKRTFRKLWASMLRDNCNYDLAVAAFTDIATLAKTPAEREGAEGDISKSCGRPRQLKRPF